MKKGFNNVVYFCCKTVKTGQTKNGVTKNQGELKEQLSLVLLGSIHGVIPYLTIEIISPIFFDKFSIHFHNKT